MKKCLAGLTLLSNDLYLIFISLQNLGQIGIFGWLIFKF